MTLAKNAFQYGETLPVSVPPSSDTSSSVQVEKEDYTLEEVFDGIQINFLNLEEALEILEISESEFKEQLHSRGFCKPEHFDRNEEFPVEWIRALDTGKWKLY